MNPRTTGVLALVAILLGGFIYFYEIEGESGRQAALDEGKRIFPGLEADAVDVIEFSTLDGIEARFVRVDGRWRLSEPVDDLADSVAIDAIAGALTSLARKGSISVATGSAENGHEQYGLGTRARIVRFIAGGESYRLGIGRNTPVGRHLYVRRLGTNESSKSSSVGAGDDDGNSSGHGHDDVAYVESFRLNALNRNLDDLRERRVLGFDGAELSTLRITWPRERTETGGAEESEGPIEVALARDADGDWQMGAPVRGAADQEMLRDLISDLSYLRATRFVDERSDRVEAALANPAITFHWTLSGDHVESRMRIGGDFENGLLVEGPRGRLVTIGAGRLKDFKHRIVDYRFKSVSEFNLVDARHFSIEFSDSAEGQEPATLRVEAALEEAGWIGSARAIDPDRATDLIRTLSSLRATDILAEEMGPRELAGLGLSPPRVRIRVGTDVDMKDESGILADLRLGRLVSGRGLLAQRVGDPTVFILAESVVQRIPISADAFANRFEKQTQEVDGDLHEPDREDLMIDPLEGIEFP
jgi:hypothetical protein